MIIIKMFPNNTKKKSEVEKDYFEQDFTSGLQL